MDNRARAELKLMAPSCVQLTVADIRGEGAALPASLAKWLAIYMLGSVLLACDHPVGHAQALDAPESGDAESGAIESHFARRPLAAAAIDREPMIIARSKSSAILGDHAETIALENSDSRSSLALEVASLKPDQRIYLVFRGIKADRQPGILYRIYLDLPADVAEQHAPDYYVGTVNFFNFVTRHAPSGLRQARSQFRSYDVTELLARLAHHRMLARTPTVTIVPAGRPEADSYPTLGRIEIVVQ